MPALTLQSSNARIERLHSRPMPALSDSLVFQILHWATLYSYNAFIHLCSHPIQAMSNHHSSLNAGIPSVQKNHTGCME